MKKYTVVIADGTVGTFEAHISSKVYIAEGLMALIGQSLVIQLHNENGDFIEKEGIVIEVLSEEEIS